MALTLTTDLPDAQDIDLDASVQSEMTAAWGEVINNGEYRLELRDDDPDGDHPPYQHETTVGYQTLSHTITNLVDGEQYSVRIRTQTNYRTGSWLEAEEITKLIPADQLTASPSETAVALTWVDVSDFRGSYELYRNRADYSYNDPEGELVATVSDTTESYDDSDVAPGREYEYVVRARTQWVYADATVTTTTDSIGLSGRAVPARGWYVEVDHPSGTTYRPQILDGARRRPRANGLPQVRVPVPTHDKWFSDSLEDGTPMRVWVDGDRLPIGELDRVEHSETDGEAVLVGVGGTDLETRVEHEVNQQATHTLVEELITQNTDLVANVDAPETPVEEDVQMLTAETTAELLSDLGGLPETSPVYVEGDEIRVYDTAWTREAEDWDRESGRSLGNTDGRFSDGDSIAYSTDASTREWDFSIDYTIPEGEFAVYYRNEADDTDGTIPHITWSIDGTEIGSTNNFLSLGWSEVFSDRSSSGAQTDPPELQPGTHTLTAEIEDGDGDGGVRVIDVVAPADDRFGYTFDNDNGGAGGYLDGPETKPDAVEATFDEVETPFSVLRGYADITIDDTSNGQAIALSNDYGSSWIETSNTTSASADFDEPGGSLTLRLTLSRYGTRDTATPRTGFEDQRVSSVDLRADVDETPLSIDQKHDNSLLAILQGEANRTDSLFEVQTGSNGQQTLEWTQPGQRSSQHDLSTSGLDLDKHERTFQKVTVKGSNSSVSGEPFVADDAFVSLANSQLVNGSETVYDSDGNQFDRGEDYEIGYSDGEIRRLSGGDLDAGASYRIDYEFDVEGSYTVDGAPDDPRELVEDLTSLTSVRACEQAAFALARVLSSPRWEGAIELPRDEVGFQVADALVFDDVPDQAVPLEIREIDHTPASITLSVGRSQSVGDAVDEIRNRLADVSRLT